MTVPPVLSIGAVLDPDPVRRAWRAEIATLGTQIIGLRDSVESVLRLNVIFHVPPAREPLEFAGVRTGRFQRRDSWLQVQAAVPRDQLDQGRATLLRLLSEAIDEAERFGQRKGLVERLDGIRGILAMLDE